MTKLSPILSIEPEPEVAPCPQCGDRTLGAMLKSGICYECDLRARGLPSVEAHHIIGRDVDLTILIPANLHRAISQRQAARRPILKRPSDDPLIQIARCVTITAELFEVGADYLTVNDFICWLASLCTVLANLCRRAADQLLTIAHSLIEQHGPDWWEGRILWPSLT
jgi:hypothetical protein